MLQFLAYRFGHARIIDELTQALARQLEVMITKSLDYERNPPTSADFYDHPITALG